MVIRSAFLSHVCEEVRVLVEEGKSLAALFEIVNGRRAKLQSELVRLLVAVHDAGQGTLALLNAGHEPPFHYRPGIDTIRDFPSSSLPLGCSEDLGKGAPGEASIPVREGDVLVCYTDGVSERCNKSKEPYTAARLKETTRGALRDGAAARAIVEAIKVDCERHANGEPPRDDVALVVATF